MFQPGSNIYSNGPGGTNPENSEVPIISDRAPTPNDVFSTNTITFPLGKRWIWKENEVYVLVGFSSTTGILQANWQLIDIPPGISRVIVTHGITPVYPDSSGNVNLTSSDNSIIITGTSSNTIDYASNVDVTTKYNIPSGISPVTSNMGYVNFGSVDESVIVSGTTDNTMDYSYTFETIGFKVNDGGIEFPYLKAMNIRGNPTGSLYSSILPILTTVAGSNVVTFTTRTAEATGSGGSFNGVATFNSADFTVDPTGFVELSQSVVGITSLNVQTFKNSGTYIATPGTKYCLIQAVGGGGGGGGVQSQNAGVASGSGGGAGGYAVLLTDYATANGLYITVGDRGYEGNSASGGIGGIGGATLFGSLFTCLGGSGGTGTTRDAAAFTCVGGLGGSVLGTTSYSCTGAQGNTSACLSTGSYSFSYSGQGASSPFGNGGSNVGSNTAGTSIGNSGGFGSGGSGAYINATPSSSVHGGYGGKGFVTITEFISS